MNKFTSPCWLATVMVITGLWGCTVHPQGEREERDSTAQAGKPFEKPIENRQVIPLPENPTPDQLVEYALLNNAELEQRFWEWRSAIEQIPQDGTQTTTLNVAAGTSITNGRASWGSSTVSLSNDPMTDIKWPGKLDAAARQDLEIAKAAGQRFLMTKYELRDKVLSAYYDYALNAELIRLEHRNQQLLQTMVSATDARNTAGSSGPQDVLEARTELEMSGNEIARMRSQLPSQRAAINALLSRAVEAPLQIPTALPSPQPIAYTDAELAELVVKQNPTLSALTDEIHGRDQGVRLAKLQYVPDFNFSAGTDLMGITQSVLGQATIPIFRFEAIDSAIAQAEANLRASEAMRRQTVNDLAAQVTADITMIRDADRQLELFQQTILPRTRLIVNVRRSAYESGQASLLDLLGDQRSLIGIERVVANLRISREKTLADLETLTANDLSRRSASSQPSQ
jgi:outer membrane protein, heavy metal efflux system